MPSANSVVVPARVGIPNEFAVGAAAVQGPNVACHGVVIRGRCPGQEIFIGNSNAVTTGTGFPLADAENLSFEVKNLNQLWFIASAAAQAVRYLPYSWV